MKIDGVIFDADGTLLDSMDFWSSTVFDMLREFGINADNDTIKILTPLSMYEGAVYLIRKYSLTISPEKFIEKENRIVEEFYSNSVNLKKGAFELITMLENRNIPMAIATATDKYLIEKALHRNNIYDCFRAVVSCSDIGEGKSSPTVFHTARSYLDTAVSNTAITEDSPDALCTAKNAGYITVGIYDKAHSSDIHKEICDLWFSDRFDKDIFSQFI